MSAEAMDMAAHIVALVLTLAALATALGAVTARSLFAACMFVAATGALGAVAVLALGAADGALAQVLFGIGIAPFLLLAAMLLSARAAKPRPRLPWLTIVAAILVGGAVLWATPELGVRTPVAGADGGSIAPWLAGLVFVAIAGCVALLGYGERGAFGGLGARDE